MTWLLSLAKKIPREVYAFGVLLILLGLLLLKVYHLGQDNIQVKWDASTAKGRKIVEHLKQNQGLITTKIVTQTVERVKVIHEKGEVRIQRIPVYIPVDSPDLPGGFRLLHDAAAANAIPEDAGTFAERVPLRTATETIDRNYQTCNKAIEELRGLRQWGLEQREAYLAECKRLGRDCSKDN